MKGKKDDWLDDVAKEGGSDLCLLLPYPILSQERELCDPGIILPVGWKWMELRGS